ncbi:MAG: sigma-54-dependent transcriptional regulator [Bacteroidota bacterium]
MTTLTPSILIVDDDENILYAFQKVFKPEGYQCLTASNGEDAVNIVSSESPDIVFMDITMPKLDGLEALKQMKNINPLMPVILVTGFGTMQTAVKAIQLGAFDYLTKPLDVKKIREITKKVLASSDVNVSPQKEEFILKGDVIDRYELIGNSQPMQEVYKLIGSISTTPNHTSVLLLGESGTGKELVARAIHANGTHAKEPFIAINCTALPDSLLESELFGHEKGAFTGAGDRKLGKFEIARNGTIFLDEIGTLSPNLQKKLLRVLQEREFERVGGNNHIQVEARFITATNLDLLAEVKKKIFREDLYFRLNVALVQLPPLRDRMDDVPLLANYFLSKFNGQLSKSIKGFSEEAISTLQAYTYPGNVRELENIMERAVMLTKGEIILPDVLHELALQSQGNTLQFHPVDQRFSLARAKVIDLFEKQFLEALLDEHHGNVSAAAKASGMTRQNLQRLMNKHHIRAETFRK